MTPLLAEVLSMLNVDDLLSDTDTDELSDDKFESL